MNVSGEFHATVDEWSTIELLPTPKTAAPANSVFIDASSNALSYKNSYGATSNISLTGNIVNVKDFGAAGDGGTPDKAALQACAAYVHANIGMIDGLYFPPGIYCLDLPEGTELFKINKAGAGGFRIIAHNATIRRTNAYAVEKVSWLFSFDNCTSVECCGLRVDSAILNDPVSDPTNGTNRGFVVYQFLDNNTNIRLLQQEVLDNQRLATFQGRNNTTTNKNIKIQGRVVRCEYGVTFLNTGDNADIQLYGEHLHRTYYPFGVDNHKVQMEVVNPRTVTAMIGAEDKDTTNLNIQATVYFSDDAAHRMKSNGGIEFYPVARKDKTAVGHIRGVKLDVTLIDTGTSGINYRPFIAFGCSKYEDATMTPGSIQNVTVTAIIKGWNGNALYRPAIGFTEVTGYNPDGTPTFNSGSGLTWFEPELADISINASIHTPDRGPSRRSAMELSMTKLKGTFAVTFEGNMSPSIRNLGQTGRVIMHDVNINKRFYSGNGLAALDHVWVAGSNNHSIDHYSGEDDAASAKPAYSKVIYGDYRYNNMSATPPGSLSVDIPLFFVKPLDSYFYKINGRSAQCNFEGILEVRFLDGLFQAASRIVQWEARKHAAPLIDVSAELTPAITLTGGGAGLNLRLTSSGSIVTAEDLTNAKVVLFPYEQL